MADINIRRDHTLGVDEGRNAIEQVAQKLESELGVDYHWDDNILRFDGSGADGHIEVESDVVHVAINLSMFLSPMQGRVKEEAEDYLDRYLAS